MHSFRGDPLRARIRVASALVQTATWLIELGVGLACLAVGAIALRNPRMRVVGVVLLIAGTAAAVHAASSLISG